MVLFLGVVVVIDLPNAPLECVMYEKLMDSHGIAQLTVPVTGDYLIKELRTGWTVKHFKAGVKLTNVVRLIGRGCPGYEEIKQRAKLRQGKTRTLNSDGNGWENE